MKPGIDDVRIAQQPACTAGLGAARTADEDRAKYGDVAMSGSDQVQPLLLVQWYLFTKSAKSVVDLIAECLKEIVAAIRRRETAGQVTELLGAIPPLCEWQISTAVSLDDIRSALGMDQSQH